MTNQDLTRQQFKNTINKLYSETAHERELVEHLKPRNLEEGMKYVGRIIYLVNIEMLKEFVDRNYEGEKPKLIISAPHKEDVPGGELEDVLFALTDPEYNQNALDTLKNFSILPEDSQLSDYAFLFTSNQAEG